MRTKRNSQMNHFNCLDDVCVRRLMAADLCKPAKATNHLTSLRDYSICIIYDAEKKEDTQVYSRTDVTAEYTNRKKAEKVLSSYWTRTSFLYNGNSVKMCYATLLKQKIIYPIEIYYG